MLNSQGRINVMTLVTAMETGGLEVYLVRILQTIDRNKFNVTIVCTGRDSNWYKEELDALEVRTLFCPNPYSQVGFVRRIATLMHELNTDVVCDFRGDFAAPTLWAARRQGIKSRIAMYRSADPLFQPSLLRNGYARLMHRGTRRWATRIIGNSKSVLDAFYPDWAALEKYAVSYNGVDLNDFRPGRDAADVRRSLGIPEDAFVVGHVGRFHEAKNHRVILATFARVRSTLSGAHLLLVGDGHLRGAIEAQIAELHLDPSVTLAGRRKDVESIFPAMDLFLFPSLFEGHPNALIEAMACGIPLVASNIGPVVESVPVGCADDLFATDDEIAMAQRIIHYAHNSAERQETGSELRQHVECKFGLKAAAERLCSFWTEDL